MKKFKHVAASSIDEVVSILSKYNEKAKIIAGGTDLLGELKDEIGPTYPEVLVNIKTIPNLEYIKEDEDGLKIGSLTKLYDIQTHTTVKEKYCALAEAAHGVGSPQIRNMGTIGGNLCQDVRCWYYRNTKNRFNCIRKGGKVCYAIAGDNRYQSIFGGVGGCMAAHPSDIAPALIALNAEVETSKRTLGIKDFFSVKDPTKATVLGTDEMVKEIRILTPAEGTRSKFLKFRLRKAIDFPIVNVAVSITLEGGICKDARIVLNAVYPIPYRATAAEEAMKGKAINVDTAEAVADAVIKDAVTTDKNKYKVPITKALVKRAILYEP